MDFHMEEIDRMHQIQAQQESVVMKNANYGEMGPQWVPTQSHQQSPHYQTYDSADHATLNQSHMQAAQQHTSVSTAEVTNLTAEMSISANVPHVINGAISSPNESELRDERGQSFRNSGQYGEMESTNPEVAVNGNFGGEVLSPDNFTPRSYNIPQAHKQISLEKAPDEKLGITVKESPDGRIIIGRVLKGEKADLSGLVSPGDIIVSVNGRTLTESDTKESVIDMVAQTKRNLDLIICPQSDTTLQVRFDEAVDKHHQEMGSVKEYVKSRINWDPAKDQGIPCSDVTMSSQIRIGDILEILSKDDDNWWQARKVCSIFDKDTCFSKPGVTQLIPSPQLLESRVKTKVALIQSNQNSVVNSPTSNSSKNNSSPSKDPDSPSKKGSVLKRLKSSASRKKRDKSKDRNNERERSLERDNTPDRQERPEKNDITSSPSRENTLKLPKGAHSNSVKVNEPYIALRKLTNQELKQNQKRRPIAIIGPRGIGIMDLRSKLIDTNPSLYDLPVPHTSRPALINEIDGKDYNFVSKEEMTKFIKEGKMIEWGQYNDHYYGTSVDAVKLSLYNHKVSLVAPMNLNQAIPKLSQKQIQSFIILVMGPKVTRQGSAVSEEKFDENMFENQEQFRKICEEGESLFKKHHQIIDKVIVYRDFDSAFRELEQASFALMNFDQFYPKSWVEDE